MKSGAESGSEQHVLWEQNRLQGKVEAMKTRLDKLLVDQGAMKQSIEAAKVFNDRYIAAAKPLKR